MDTLWLKTPKGEYFLTRVEPGQVVQVEAGSQFVTIKPMDAVGWVPAEMVLPVETLINDWQPRLSNAMLDKDQMRWAEDAG